MPQAESTSAFEVLGVRVDVVQVADGPELFQRFFADPVPTGTRHLLYGGAPGVAESLAAVLERRYPDARLVDTMTPPFRELTSAEEQDVVDRINAAAPDVVWVGLSTPKGPRFVAKSLAELFRESLQDRAL